MNWRLLAQGSGSNLIQPVLDNQLAAASKLVRSCLAHPPLAAALHGCYFASWQMRLQCCCKPLCDTCLYALLVVLTPS